MSQTDIEYIESGMFTRFVPCTPAGEDAWREMAKEDGSAAILNMHAKSVISQLRKAGYSVSKAKKPTQSVDDLMAELEMLDNIKASGI